MIFKNICQKTYVLTFRLGMKKYVAEGFKFHRLAVVPAVFTEGKGMGGKIKHSGKMSVFSDKFMQLFFSHVEDFGHGKSPVFFKGMFFQVFQQFSDAAYVFDHVAGTCQAVRPVRFAAWKGRIFFYIHNGVDAEAGNAFFHPPVNHLVKLFQQPGVVPV